MKRDKLLKDICLHLATPTYKQWKSEKLAPATNTVVDMWLCILMNILLNTHLENCLTWWEYMALLVRVLQNKIALKNITWVNRGKGNSKREK